jgi:hypothetical protein
MFKLIVCGVGKRSTGPTNKKDGTGPVQFLFCFDGNDDGYSNFLIVKAIKFEKRKNQFLFIQVLKQLLH